MCLAVTTTDLRREEHPFPYRIFCVVGALLVFIQVAQSFALTRGQRTMSTKFQSLTALTLTKSKCQTYITRCSLQMKDASASYWFNIGDKVQVSSSVKKDGIELKGRVGEVTETWEKCDVDPTCCCAEFVDENFAVMVKFEELDPDTERKKDFVKGIHKDKTLTHYFNEDELIKVVDEVVPSSPIAFDGMSCKAFKLEQLKIGKRSRSIAQVSCPKQADDNVS